MTRIFLLQAASLLEGEKMRLYRTASAAAAAGGAPAAAAAFEAALLVAIEQERLELLPTVGRNRAATARYGVAAITIVANVRIHSVTTFCGVAQRRLDETSARPPTARVDPAGVTIHWRSVLCASGEHCHCIKRERATENKHKC